MRLEVNFQIGGTGTRLLLHGPIAQENLGKIWEKFDIRNYQLLAVVLLSN